MDHTRLNKDKNESDMSNMCNVEVDSNEHMHMLFECEKSTSLWQSVIDWIRQIGIAEYEICEKDKILGDHRCPFLMKAIILNTKKIIFNAKTAGTIPYSFSVKNNVLQM